MKEFLILVDMAVCLQRWGREAARRHFRASAILLQLPSTSHLRPEPFLIAPGGEAEALSLSEGKAG